jgi:lipoprotein-releasing system permease protein
MRFEFFIAKRYLLKGRKYSFVSTISIVSTIGITIGVAALIIALSLVNGFHGDIINKILSSTPHIMVRDVNESDFDGYEEILKGIKEQAFKEIVSVEPVVFGTVLLKGVYKNAAGAVLKGIDLDVPRTESWLKKLLRGRLPLETDQLLIGSQIASNIGLLEEETCTLIAPRPSLSDSSFVPRIKRFLVSGIFESGLYEIDSQTIITNLDTAQEIFELDNKISYIRISLEDIFDAEDTALKLRAMIPPRFSVITWKELKASLYSALRMEKNVLFLTLTLIIIVASLNIIAGLMLLVIQKIKDIGILTSYGATPRIIKRIFFIQGSIIGILGTGAGVTIGLIFCYFANAFELIKVPSDIFQMSYVPFSIHLFDFFAVVVVSLLISFTATLIPSKKAASVNVVEAIKNE